MVVRAIEVDKLAAAAGNLPVGGRQRRWGHLSLHVIDACLSATDPQLAAQACWGYAYSAGLRRVQVAAELIPLADEQDLRSFWRHCVTGRSGPHLHGQRGAVTRVAQVLIDHRLTDLGSVGSTCGDHDLLERISVELLDAFPLLNPQRWWRSVGDDCYIELDPPVRGWCTKVLGYPAPPQHLRDLLPGVAWTLGVTPWQLTATIRSAAQPAHEDVAPAEIDLATHLDLVTADIDLTTAAASAGEQFQAVTARTERAATEPADGDHGGRPPSTVDTTARRGDPPGLSLNVVFQPPTTN